uniref:Uncharacterized protein n=1 Tax=Monopterus albus TaxID=43700 RepID=A0A3Q3IN07_MONAL
DCHRTVICKLRHLHAACWLVLIGYLLDLADGAVARQLDACSALGAKLDEFADFTNFGIATSLLLRTPDLLDNILIYSSVIAVAMILFMISQTFYPHDRVLESQAWKKVVYAGGYLLWDTSSQVSGHIWFFSLTRSCKGLRSCDIHLVMDYKVNNH